MEPGARWWGRHVLARSLCRAHRVSLAGIAPRDRMGRLRVEAAAWRPFDDCEHVALLQGDTAWLYAWDRAAFERRWGGGTPPRVTRMLPETLLFAPPAADGPRLLRCVEGVAAEHWQGGALQATRWWPQAPDAAEWALFLRSAGLPAGSAAPPAPEAPGAAGAAAWSRVRRLADAADGEAFSRPWVLPLLAVALVVPAVWLARDVWAVERELQALAAEQEALQGLAAGPARARQQTLAALADIDTVQRWLAAPDPTALLAEVARRLPADGSVLRRFEVADGRVQLALTPAAATPRVAYVTALESGGLLSGVREEAGEGREAGWLLLRAAAAASAPASAPGSAPASLPASAPAGAAAVPAPGGTR